MKNSKNHRGETTQHHISKAIFIKFGQEISEILQIFNFSWQLSWVFKILNFYWQMQSGGLSCIIMRNFVKICLMVFEILWFFKMAAAATVQFKNSLMLLSDEVRRAIVLPNFIKISHTIVEKSWFLDFSRWRPLPSWILDIWSRKWAAISTKSQSGISLCKSALYEPSSAKICQLV